MLDFQKISDNSSDISKQLGEIVFLALATEELSRDASIECFENYKKLKLNFNDFQYFSSYPVLEKINYFSLYNSSEPSFLHFQKDFIDYYDSLLKKSITYNSICHAINNDYFDTFLSIYPEIGMKYLEHYVEYYQIPNHPLLSSYLSLYDLTCDLKTLDLEKVSIFWKTHYEDFSFDEPVIEGGDVNSHEFYLTYIKLLKRRISRSLFSHFILHPEQQENLNSSMPVYFTFFKWLNNFQFETMHLYFTDKHIDSLSYLKNERYYHNYINKLFLHHFDIENNNTNIYTNYLKRLIHKNINWDLLLSNIDLTLTDSSSLNVSLHNKLSTILNYVIDIASNDTVYDNSRFIADIKKLQQQWLHYQLNLTLEHKVDKLKAKL